MADMKIFYNDLIIGVFKSPINPTKFLIYFFPSFIGQKSVKNLVGFLGDLKTPKFLSEIKSPLLNTMEGSHSSIDNDSGFFCDRMVTML